MNLGATLRGTPRSINSSARLPRAAMARSMMARVKIGSLAASSYTDASWYTDTAGIAAFPPDRPLTDAELTGLDQHPLGRLSRSLVGSTEYRKQHSEREILAHAA